MEPAPRGSRRALVVAASVVAVALAWLNGFLVRTLTVHVGLLSDTADRGDHRVAAGAGLATAVLLLLALPALRSLRAPAWLEYAAAAGAATQLALGLTSWWSSRPEDDSEVVTRSAWTGVTDVLTAPGSWPLLALLVVVLVVGVRSRVRGRSSLTPR